MIGTASAPVGQRMLRIRSDRAMLSKPTPRNSAMGVMTGTQRRPPMSPSTTSRPAYQTTEMPNSHGSVRSAGTLKRIHLAAATAQMSDPTNNAVTGP